MESLVFIALTPLAIILMLVVILVAWRRRDAPGGRALSAFSAVGLAWLLCDALALLAPSPEAAVWMVKGTFLFGPLLGVSWLAFVLSYTDHFHAPARAAVGALTLWSVVYGGLAFTNDAHRWVWTAWEVVPAGAFAHTTYTLGPLGWAQTVFSWASVSLSLGVLLWAYAGSGSRSRDLSRWIVAGALPPMAVNAMFLVGVGPLEKDFTPIAMALSSASFAVGLARYRLLDLRPVARAALVDDLREGMLVLDASGRVVDVNPALERALAPSKAAIGQPLAETAPALAHAVAVAPEATVQLGDSADARYYDLRISPLADRKGASRGCLVLLHDVTHRREERAALHRANADLYDANTELQARNEELDAFAHTVAHDLKNSIQGVLGYAEVLREDGPDLPAHEHHEVAHEVVTTAKKMGVVVHELLLLAGVRQGVVEPAAIDMGAVLGEAAQRVRSAFPVSGTRFDPSIGEVVALGYAPWVEEIWVNYLSNALKYGGPTVTVGAAATDAQLVRFWVHDDGPGIPSEAQRELFVPFSRVGSEDVEGHGLGLSIVRRIVERLGGTCGVESGPGIGTRFWFALPRAPEPAEAVRSPTALMTA